MYDTAERSLVPLILFYFFTFCFSLVWFDHAWVAFGCVLHQAIARFGYNIRGINWDVDGFKRKLYNNLK